MLPLIMTRRLLVRRLLLALSLAALAGGGAFVFLHRSTRVVALVTPTTGHAVAAVYATGTVEPENWARIAPLATGRVAAMLASEGETVRQGQPLARLDDREARAKVAELEALAAYWREELGRAQTLVERGIRARESAEKARSEYDQTNAAIAAARQRRADLLVTSPLDGMVLRRDGEPGEVAGPETALFWVGEPRPLRVTADVDEEDIALVRPGQKVLIKADAFPDRVLPGTVERITPKGDPVNKTFRVRVRLPDDTPLLIGMTTEINIITREKDDALLIPAAALIKDRVLVLEDGRAAARAVVVGIRGRDRVEVLSGLAVSDRVVAAPPAGLKAGERLRAE